MFRKLILVALATSTLAGCGLAETGAAAAAGGVSEAEQAKQAKQQEEQVQKKLDDAEKAAAANRDAAEKAAE